MKRDTLEIPIDMIPMNVAIYMVSNDDFILVDFNKKAEQTENILKSDLIGKKVTDAFPGIKEMGLFDVFLRVFKSGETEILDMSFYHDERVSGWRKNTVIKLDSETIIAIYEDLSLQKELENQIEITLEEQKTTLIELARKTVDLENAQKLAKIGSWKYNIIDDTLLWSDETYNIFEIDKEKFEVKNLNDFFVFIADSEYIKLVKKEWKQHLEEKTHYKLVHKLHLEDGSFKWISEECKTVYDENGIALESNGFVQDITESKELEIKIQQGQKLLLDAQSLAHHGSWEWNIKNNSLTWSDEVFKIFGETAQSFTPTYQGFLSYVSKKDIDIIENAIWKSLKTKEDYSVIHEVIRKDGTKRYVQEIGTPYYDEFDEAVSMIGSVFDITQEYIAKQKLEIRTEELQKTFDINPNIMFVTDGREMIRANKKFFNFLGYENLADFKKKHQCICEFFEERVGYIQTNINAKNWIDYIVDNKEKIYKALIIQDKKEYIFLIHAQKYMTENREKRIVVFEDITKLEEIADRDFLTNLFNRKKTNELLINCESSFNRYNRVFSIMMLDIDYFKNVNDSYGHDVGDYVLTEISSILDKHTRETDFIGRWGGEEFLIISTETSIKGIFKLAEEIRHSIENYNFKSAGKITVSIGLGEFKKGMSTEELIKEADKALYIAKERGRNQVSY